MNKYERFEAIVSKNRHIIAKNRPILEWSMSLGPQCRMEWIFLYISVGHLVKYALRTFPYVWENKGINAEIAVLSVTNPVMSE